MRVADWTARMSRPFDPIPGGIGIGQITEDGGACFIGQTRQLAGHIVRIFALVAIGVGDAGSSIGIVVADGDHTRALRDGGKPIGIVVDIDHLRLAHTGHS
jgi:hypothetical protein